MKWRELSPLSCGSRSQGQDHTVWWLESELDLGFPALACAGLHVHPRQVLGLPSRGSGGAGRDTEPLFARGLGDPPPCG